MDPFGGDEDDRESGASPEGSSENEQDGQLEDRDDEDMDANGDADAEVDVEAAGENYEENEDEEDEPTQPESHFQEPKLNRESQASLPTDPTDSMQNTAGPAPTSHPNPSMLLTSPSPTQESTASNGAGMENPKLRPEVLTASVYDIVPTIAAPHSTSINSITATPDLRWVFTGGADGYIRRFNWLDTANGKSMLTVAQRHPFVDSVTKAGVLMSYWENNEDSNERMSDDASTISPVYSLAVQREGLWLLSGLESGGINLQSVRVEEGRRIARLQGHTSAISVLDLAQDERSVLSGSWDKSVIDWDLNTGQIVRKFEGSGSQISALETRPLSTLPVPEASGDTLRMNGTLKSDGEDKPRVNGISSGDPPNGSKIEPLFGEQVINGDAGSPNDSLFGGNDGDSLFGDTENDVGAPSGGNFINEEDDDFSRAIADVSREPLDEPNPEQQEMNAGADRDVHLEDVGDEPAKTPVDKQLEAEKMPDAGSGDQQAMGQDAFTSTSNLTNGLPHDVELTSKTEAHDETDGNILPQVEDPSPTSNSTFLAAAIDGTLRVWDKRQLRPIAKMAPQNVPPWCMNATWSPDGNFIYAGRRNGTVDEYSLYKGLQGSERSFKLPNNSGPVSALRAMPNGRHLICASYDILRLYDLQQQQIFKHATVPFLIVPGHRTGVVASLYMDPSCRYLISAAGNRGWEGSTTEVLLGYEVGVPK